jgi:hypothetical protein
MTSPGGEMRWFCGALAGCATSWCPQVVDPFDEVTTCSTEHEACGREATCAHGLDCVSTLLCTVGPCPGFCMTACDDEQDCGSDEYCGYPDGWDHRYCLEISSSLN